MDSLKFGEHTTIRTPNGLKLSIWQKLRDLFINEWFSSIENSNKELFYRIFKTDVGLEPYFKNTPTSLVYYRSTLKLRTRNHRLPIETGRWIRTPQNERLCLNCNKLGDEYHYLFECSIFDNERKDLIKRYFYYRNPSTLKLQQLMNTTNKHELLKLFKMFKSFY